MANASASRVSSRFAAASWLTTAARWSGTIPLIAAAVVLAYVAAAWVLVGEAGYPLDDAWIHQVLARNVVMRHEIALNPGQPAALSSAPLWTAAIAAGYALGADPFDWTALLGAASAAALAAGIAGATRAAFPRIPAAASVAALALALDWRLAWLAASGMETVLFAALCLAAIWSAAARRPPLLHGALAGAAALVRPEGLLLAVLLALHALADVRPRVAGDDDAGTSWFVGKGEAFAGPPIARVRPRRRMLRPYTAAGGDGAGGGRSRRAYEAGARVLGAAVVVAAPAFVLNWALSGSPLPQTAIAKQVAYTGSIGTAIGFLPQAVRAIVWGPSVFVLVGLVWWPVMLRRGRAPAGSGNGWLFVAWPCVLVAAYAWRLPATYHYGRYVLPALPPLVALGAVGGVCLWQAIPLRRLAITYVGLVVAGSVVLCVHGATRYAADVRWIQDEQVAAARWIDATLPAGAVVATHDVGAIAYFARRRVVDTAGLADPGALPYLHDPLALLAWARTRGATHLAYFPAWYPQLAPGVDLECAYATRQAHAAETGFADFVVCSILT